MRRNSRLRMLHHRLPLIVVARARGVRQVVVVVLGRCRCSSSGVRIRIMGRQCRVRRRCIIGVLLGMLELDVGNLVACCFLFYMISCEIYDHYWRSFLGSCDFTRIAWAFSCSLGWEWIGWPVGRGSWEI